MLRDLFKLSFLRQALLFGLLLIVPLANSHLVLEAALSPKLLALNFFLLLTGIGLLFHKPILLKINPKSLAVFLLFMLSMIASLFYTKDTGINLFEIAKFTSYGIAVLFLLAIYKEDGKRFIYDFCRSAVFVSIFFGIHGLYQLADIVANEKELTHQLTYRIMSVFMNRNVFMQFLCLLIPFSVYSLFKFEKLRLYAGIALSFSLILIVVCQTRSVWLALLFSSAVLFLMRNSKRDFLKSKKFWRFSMFLGSLVLLSTILYASFGNTDTFRKQISTAFNFRYSSVQDRKILWKNSISVWKENPIIGCGIGDWKLDQMQYTLTKTKAATALSFFQRAHNDFLWVAAEQGIIGLVLFVLLFLVLIKAIRRNLKSDSEPDFQLVLIFALVSFIVIASFSFPKERIELGVLVSLVFAAAFMFSSASNAKTYSLNRGFIAICLVLLSFSGWICYERMKAEYIIKNEALTGPESRYLSINPNLYSYTPSSIPLDWLLGFEYLNTGKDSLSALYFKKALKASPFNPQVLNSYAVVLDSENKTDSAKSLLKEAVRIAHLHDEAYLNLAMIYYREGNIDSAKYNLQLITADYQHANYQFLKKELLLPKDN